jgi:hypothetical protein
MFRGPVWAQDKREDHIELHYTWLRANKRGNAGKVRRKYLTAVLADQSGEGEIEVMQKI